MHAENLRLSFLSFFFFFAPYHSPAERAVLGCQLGPACTSQGRGRHSQTQPESIQACNTVPFDSPHSSDFSQAEIAGGERRGQRGKGERVTEKAELSQGESQGTIQKWKRMKQKRSSGGASHELYK